MSIKKTAAVLSFSLALTVGGAWAQRPTSPEQMSGKTAIRFFADNDIKAGINLGNRMDATSGTGAARVAQEGAWGAGRTPQAFFQGARESGFDIVRIPVTWIGKIGPAPNYTLDAAWLARADTLVNWAKSAGFKAIIINVHHDGNSGDAQTWGFLDLRAALASDTRKAEIQDQLSKVWTQIANHFKNYGDYLIFETLNEVHDGSWGDCGNPSGYGSGNCAVMQGLLYDWKQAALNAIRATGGNNATRYVSFPGLGSTEPHHVTDAHSRGKLLPNDGANGTDKQIVSVHFYHPWQYTVADITGQGGDGRHTLTNSERNQVATNLATLKSTFINNGIAVYVGEWGAQTNVRASMSAEIKATHIDYISTVAGAIRANGAVPIYWDDGGNFMMLNKSNGRPPAGFHADVHSAMMTAIGTGVTPPDCTPGVNCVGDPCPAGQTGTYPNCTTLPQGEYTGAKTPITLPPPSGWETVNDNSAGGQSNITLTVNNGTLQVNYTLTQAGYEWDPYVSAKLAQNVSACGWGIGYSYKGSAHALRAQQSDVTNGNNHGVQVAASADWTTVTLPWSSFVQADWGENTQPMAQDRTKVEVIEWFVIGANGTGSFEVKDVYCLTDAGGSSAIGPRSSRPAASARPTVAVRGRTLSVSSPNNSELTVRMFDTMGRVRARFDAASGSGNFALTNIPAGRYFVDVRGIGGIGGIGGVRQTLPVVIR